MSPSPRPTLARCCSPPPSIARTRRVRPLHSRRGTTLIELVAALSIAGLALLGGALLVDQLNDQAARIGQDGNATARVGNGHRLLHRLFAEAQPSLDSTEQLRGASRSVELRTRCDSPFGWTEPCQA